MTIHLSRDYLQKVSQARTWTSEEVELQQMRDQRKTEETLLEREKTALSLQELKNQRLEVSLQVFRAKERERELIKELRAFQARVQFCRRCGFWFNIVSDADGEKVVPREERVRKSKQFCDEELGDPDCVAERKAAKERQRKAAKGGKGAVSQGGQQRASTPAATKRPHTARVQHPPYVY
jgi:hypothetical protein